MKKISDLDVSLNSADDSEEDLYMMSVSFQSFYDELSPVGDWIKISKDEINEDLKDGEGQGLASDIIEVDGEIYVWHPTGFDDDWHPYLNGNWVYTTQGWLWASNYSWGWAVYHYGRWWNSKVFGWVWLPGHVWAPAWVKWKVTEGHVGWCPLTPYARWSAVEGVNLSNYHYSHRDDDWVFISKSKFTDEITNANRVELGKNSSYIKSSTDILTIKFENSKIQNFGPDVRDIETKTGRKVILKEIELSKSKSKPQVGENDVALYKQDFQKLVIDPSTGKPKQIDKPKVYKIAQKIKKHTLKKRIRHRTHRLKRH